MYDGLSLFVFVADLGYKSCLFPVSALNETTARYIAANAHNVPELRSESAWELLFQYPESGDPHLPS